MEVPSASISFYSPLGVRGEPFLSLCFPPWTLRIDYRVRDKEKKEKRTPILSCAGSKTLARMPVDGTPLRLLFMTMVLSFLLLSILRRHRMP